MLASQAQLAHSFAVINPSYESHALLVCDHASNVVERGLPPLGVAEDYLSQHIAYDIGTQGVTRKLSDLLRAPAVLAQFSRLVIDANRYPSDDSSIPEVSDEVSLPMNLALSEADKLARLNRYFKPYHDQISIQLNQVLQRSQQPFIISIHSFTPYMQGVRRPWELGVLHELEDDPQARQLVNNLRAQTQFNIGVNQPYNARVPLGYTLSHHAIKNAFPHLLVEIRQDLIANQSQQDAMAEVLHQAISPIVEASAP